MKPSRATLRAILSVLALAALLALSACGGGAGGASVGDCIDSGNNVVDCNSSSASQKLATDLSQPDALSCSKTFIDRQQQVTVDGKQFCAEKVK